MSRKPRKKGVTPLQIMQFVGPQGLMRRIDVAELSRRREQDGARKAPETVRTEPDCSRISR